MTPQEYNFNAKIWANLEQKIRDYAVSSDTLYVVTGCVLDGSTTYSGSNSGFTVKVPAAYFKAALQKSTSTSVGRSGWRAAAWYLPHDSGIASGRFTDYVMTVDALEAKLGYDLFVNLPPRWARPSQTRLKQTATGPNNCINTLKHEKEYLPPACGFPSGYAFQG